MSAAPVFLDTFALVALAARSDTWHQRAKAVESELTAARTQLVTSDWVLAEYLNTASHTRLREAAARVVERLRSSPRVNILEAGRSDWLAAFDLYRSRADKDWSFIDCTSILCCQSRSINRVFTHDHHFGQAGMEILLH